LREQKCIAANEQLGRALQSEGPFDLVYERYSLWSFAGMEYARSTATPGLLEVNAPLIEEQAEHRGLVDLASARLIAERVFSAATVLMAVSDEVAEHLQTFPAAQGKVRVVPNGVNPERFPPGIRASLPADPGVFTVGFVGTMKPWHGLPTLLEAFALLIGRHPESRVLLVGDGTARANLEEQASALGLAQTARFTGPVTPNEVPGLLASMDVAVAPYPDLANFYFSPLKVYEYMAAGLPVVASRLGQIEKLLEPEIDGLLVPPGDVPALVAALERLKGDPELRLRLGQAARAKVIRDHTWDGVVQRILALAGTNSSPHVEAQPRTANVA
jgi:glycosyltransferase involved in cell wall biosynthesis